MRYLTADYIFPITQEPIKNGVLVVDNDGTILEVLNQNNDIPKDKIEHFEGILCPGFINSHCHLELSHLKGQIKEHTHIYGFVEELQSKRTASENLLQEAIQKADTEMIANGIVAVGDISNGSTSFQQKADSKIFYHTFIELFGFNPDAACQNFEKALDLKKQLEQMKLSASIVPHSPYSVSEKLFNLIRENHLESLPICIHNQENNEENTFYEEGVGKIAQMLQGFGLSLDLWEAKNQSSLVSYLKMLPKNSNCMLVHNTFTTKEDIEFAIKNHQNLYWCFCPRANQYIENTLPNFKLFTSRNLKCTIGTDSLASNYGLSVLEEIKTISYAEPSILLQELLKWSTFNGAEFLNISKTFGSFEKGKKPGVNWIKNVDLEEMRLRQESVVSLIVNG